MAALYLIQFLVRLLSHSCVASYASSRSASSYFYKLISLFLTTFIVWLSDDVVVLRLMQLS